MPTHNPPGDKGPESRPESQIASFRKAQPYVDAVWQFIAAVALMSWLGHWADGRFGTAPWLLVTGVFLGFATGMWSFVKVIWALDRKSTASQVKTQGDRKDGPGGPAKDGP
jgi:F0F1-type ATP synthase assembly protein I